MKADIARASFEHQTRFTRLHEKRAEAIAEVYRAAVEAEAALETLTMPLKYVGTDEKASMKNAAEKINEFVDFERRAIFLPRDALPLLRELRVAMLTTIHDYSWALQAREDRDGGDLSGSARAHGAAFNGTCHAFARCSRSRCGASSAIRHQRLSSLPGPLRRNHGPPLRCPNHVAT